MKFTRRFNYIFTESLTQTFTYRNTVIIGVILLKKSLTYLPKNVRRYHNVCIWETLFTVPSWNYVCSKANFKGRAVPKSHSSPVLCLRIRPSRSFVIRSRHWSSGVWSFVKMHFPAVYFFLTGMRSSLRKHIIVYSKAKQVLL